jgi:DNA-binding NtrC family response regulator
MMINGEFREDLYYRLKVIEVTAAAARNAATRYLASHRLLYRSLRPPLQPPGASALGDARAQLFQTYEWPGNIRELENMIKRIVILQDESLVVREMTRVGRPHAAYAVAGVGAGVSAGPSRVAPLPDVPDEADVDDDLLLDDAPATPPVGSRLADVAKSASIKAERALIEETLNSVHWNRRRAAEQLGVSYKTLLNKIKECGIARK